jgi:hypothetical protein
LLSLLQKALFDTDFWARRAGAEHSTMGGADVMGMFYLTLATDTKQ